MRTLYLLAAISVALILPNCTNLPDKKPATIAQNPAPKLETQHLKNPLEVSFYTDTKAVKRPYRILAKAKVSRFNNEGIMRQEATLRDILRQKAAAINGDAVIRISKDSQNLQAIVVTYKKTVA